VTEAERLVAAVLGQLGKIGADSVRALAALTSVVTFDELAWLLSAGERAEHCFLLTRGLVRELYLDEQGREHTRRFIREGQVTGSLLDLLSGEPSVTFIQALEPVRALRFRYRDFDLLCSKHADLQAIARRSAEELYVRKARREYELLALPAAERYARWLKTEGALDGRVSRRHLASYLGVTPEHLSRLRRR
jgi:CRP-like cAMP-binding protein